MPVATLVLLGCFVVGVFVTSPERQQVDVTIKLTLDVSTKKSRRDIIDYVGRVLAVSPSAVKKELGQFDFEIVTHKVENIKEEGEIYNNS